MKNPMSHKFKKHVFFLSLLFSGIMFSPAALSQTADGPNSVIFGFKVRAGGRFDNVRMCVASPAGVKGGMAMDVSF